jgi:hypothetical protein
MTPTPFDLSLAFTEEQAEQEATPKFESVEPSQIFGPTADGPLAHRVCRLNKARYLELRQQYMWDTGQERRPDNFYD